MLSLDSAYYVAAALCVGSLEAGRLVALALTLDASCAARARSAARGQRRARRLVGRARLRPLLRRHERRAARRAAACCSAPTASSAHAVDADRGRAAGGRDRELAARLALRDPGRAPAAARPELARRTCASSRCRAIIAEASLMPIGVVLVLLYDPEQPLGFVLLSLTYLLINFVFARLSRARARARRARARARDPERDRAPVLRRRCSSRSSSRRSRARPARRFPRPRRSRSCTAAPAATRELVIDGFDRSQRQVLPPARWRRARAPRLGDEARARRAGSTT